MTEFNTILDIPIKKLGLHENLSKRTINICIGNGIMSLRDILTFHRQNSGFHSLKNIGDKSNSELITICSKYYYHPDFNSKKQPTNWLDGSGKIKVTVNEDIDIKQLSDIEGISVRGIHVCLSRNITSLRSLLEYHYNNKKNGFLSIRNCGNMVNKELIDICLKYECYISSIETPPEDRNHSINDEYEENQSPIDEFLFNLKIDTTTFDLIKQNIVGFDYLPIFKVLDILVDNDFLFQSKIKTKIFKKTLNCYLNQDDYTLEEVGKQVGLTRERIRQIREKILDRLRYGFKRKQFSEYHDLFRGYIDSIEQPYIFITEEESININKKEGTNFSNVFISYILSKIFYDYFDLVGKFENLFNKRRSKNTLRIQNVYLVNVSLTGQFKFEKFIKYIESLVVKKHNEDIHISHQYLISNFKTSDTIDIRSIVDIINLILENDFNSNVEITPDGFCLPHKGRKNLKSLIFEVLKESDKPLHYTEIQQLLDNQGYKHSELTIHNVLVRESIFGLKGQGIYDLRSKGGLFGSIGDVTEKILLEKGRGIDYYHLVELLKKELIVSEDSIDTILFSYDLKKRFIKNSGRVYLRKWSGRGQLSLDFD